MSIEIYSPTWRAVTRWAEAQLQRSRHTLDARGVEERDADFERGRLSLARELMTLPNGGVPAGFPTGSPDGLPGDS